jgi:hypothetical protein
VSLDDRFMIASRSLCKNNRLCAGLTWLFRR